MSKSKFADIVGRGKPEAEGKSTAASPATSTPARKVRKTTKRAPGKSADRANFRQMTTYVPKKLHNEVKVRLLQETPPKELSELVAELFEAWLRSKK